MSRNAERPRTQVKVISPTSEEEWSQAEMLISELREWDVEQSRALGMGQDDVLSIFYPGEVADIRRDSVPPDGCFRIATDAGSPLGCAGFRRLTADVCELYDVYVRPSCRGRGIGSVLLQRLMSEAKSAGYQSMFLETATFMHAAHAIYKSLGFQVREPYRALPARFAEATIWMEYKLQQPQCSN